MNIDTQPQPLADEEQHQEYLIRSEALREVYEASLCFKGGSQVTAENHEQSMTEYRRFREATARARALNLTPYSIQLAFKGDINPMWIS